MPSKKKMTEARKAKKEGRRESEKKRSSGRSAVN